MAHGPAVVFDPAVRLLSAGAFTGTEEDPSAMALTNRQLSSSGDIAERLPESAALIFAHLTILKDVQFSGRIWI